MRSTMPMFVPTSPSEGEEAAPPPWEASLALELGPRPGGPEPRPTVLRARKSRGPLAVQRVFHPEGELCHVYLLHPPGGVVGGDRLDIRVEVGPGGAALATTPGAARFYRSAGGEAVQCQTLRAAAGASLEWLPQESILYGGSRVRLATRFELEAHSRLLGWEMICLGRPAGGDGWETGALEQRLEIRRGGAPLLLERLALEGGAPARDAPWGLGGRGVLATLLATPADPRTLDAARAASTEAARAHREGARPLSGLTLVDGLLVGRWLGDEAEQGRGWLEALWSAIRPFVLERPPCPPRIWRT